MMMINIFFKRIMHHVIQHKLQKNGKMNDNCIISLPWPAQSPDLNPIENLWDELKRRLRKNEYKAKNKAELFNLIKEEWYKISLAIINKLIENMPCRTKAVLKK